MYQNNIPSKSFAKYFELSLLESINKIIVLPSFYYTSFCILIILVVRNFTRLGFGYGRWKKFAFCKSDQFFAHNHFAITVYLVHHMNRKAKTCNLITHQKLQNLDRRRNASMFSSRSLLQNYVCICKKTVMQKCITLRLINTDRSRPRLAITFCNIAQN